MPTRYSTTLSPMTSLSPAAQAVMDAFLADWPDEPLAQDRCSLGAALRAAAEAVGSWDAAEQLRGLAEELERTSVDS